MTEFECSAESCVCVGPGKGTFYTNSFGFEKIADYNGPEGRFLTIALKDQGLQVLLWLGTAGKAKATPGVGTLFIESDDLRKDFAELKASGVEFQEGGAGDLCFRHSCDRPGSRWQPGCTAADAKMRWCEWTEFKDE